MLGKGPLGSGDPYVLSCQLGHWATNATLPLPSSPRPLLPSGIQGRKERCAVVFVLLFGLPSTGKNGTWTVGYHGLQRPKILAWPGFWAPSQYLGTRIPPSGNQGQKDTCLHIPSCGPPTLLLKNESN